MPADPTDAPRRWQPILKLAVLAAMVAAAGLPINDLFSYALMAVAVIVLAVGRITSRRWSWAVAGVIVAAALGAKVAVDVPRIEEGHNVFLPGGAANALVAGLPPDVYGAMAAEFDEAFPPARRCNATSAGCWQAGGRPDRVYAFSFDGIYDTSVYSRRVTGIDFSDAQWHRLGFVNELAYNWNIRASDVARGQRERGVRRLLNPWRITMPHFMMFSFPAAFAGSELCWQGKVLWEGPGERFAALRHADWACRTLAPGDAGKRIFGLAISPDAPLAMKLRPGPAIRFYQLVEPALALIVVMSLLFLLLRWQPRRLLLPLTLVGLALVVIVLSDASLLGGVRPFDDGDDGLVYDSWSRTMVQRLLAGDVLRALEGMEPVFYFTPGSRYLRAVEHMIFGETYLGYASLLLLLPPLVFSMFRRFVATRVALAAVLVFVAVPVGALFGSTFYNYVKHAAHGYGDSAAAVMFIAGTLALVGRTRWGPCARFSPAFAAGLLFALAVFVRPNLAIGTAVLLGGAGLASLWQRQGRRLAGLCIGFLPVFGMALHNWYFGGVFVPFSSHTAMAQSIPMPPLAYVSALWELLRLDFAGENLARGGLQIYRMLIGPSESFAMAPVHAAALAIVVCVLSSRRYEGWLRLIAAATLGLYSPALFFIYSDRYLLVAWLFTLLVCCVWMRDEGLPWLRMRHPGLVEGIERHPAVAWMVRPLDRFARAAGIVPAMRARAAISAA